VHPALLLGHPANSEVAKLPFNNSSSGRSFFGKKLLPKEEFVTSGSTHKLLPEERHPEEPSFGSYLFLKKKIIW